METTSVTITEAARIWGVSRQTVSRWVWQGIPLPNGAQVERVPGRHTRILMPLAVVRDYRTRQEASS